MRRIIRRREIVPDDLRYEGEPADPGAQAVQSAVTWAAASGGSESDTAVLLRPEDEVEILLPHLRRLRCIVVEFPKTGEGRGYTQGRLLRQRYGFGGELRARGALVRDQLFFLARCGFDAFDLDPAEDLEAALAAFDSFSVAYQGASDAVVHVHQRAPGT